MRFKKTKDFDCSGNYLVVDERGDVVATVYYDRQSSSWLDADNINPRHHGQDFMGFNKADVIEKINRDIASGRRVLPRRNGGGLREAKELYKEFHQFHPEKIGNFKFKWPRSVIHVGEAKVMYYASDKLNPETSEDEGWIHYFHDHEGGVQLHLTNHSIVDFGAQNGDLVDVPRWIRNLKALSRIGDCEGFKFVGLDGKKHHAKGKKPLPEWYAAPDGKALFVIQSKRTLIAVLWGGGLDVEWRGVVG